MGSETSIRRCREDERPAMLEIINAAAQRYRGAIPDDCWHDPYMPAAALEEALAEGVDFWGLEDQGRLLGVMGVQDRGAVTLIRHAYVVPAAQGRGIGSRLLQSLSAASSKPVLIGTWAAASWAIGFYESHGFVLEPRERVPELLRTYWNIPERQIETSVVLSRG